MEEVMSSDDLVFVHRFSRTVSCELRAPDQPPHPDSLNMLSVGWTGRVKRRHLNEYRQWVLCTNQVLADRWQITMLYALGTHHNRTELWSFTPGGVPKLLERLNVGIP